MAVQTVGPTDSPNTGRGKWNTNDQELESALETHKDSDDHDTQYYPKAQVDTFLDALTERVATSEGDIVSLDGEVVKVTGDQSVGGKKIFSDNLAIDKVAPRISLKDTGHDVEALLEALISGGDRSLSLYFNLGTIETPNFIALLRYSEALDRLDTVRNVYVNNKKLATEEFVGARVKTGNMVYNEGLYIAALTASTTYYIGDGIAGTGKRMVLTDDGIIQKVSITVINDAEDNVRVYDFNNLSVPINGIGVRPDAYRSLRAYIETGVNASGVPWNLKIVGEKYSTGQLLSTVLFETAFNPDEKIQLGDAFNFGLSIKYNI